MNTLVFPESGEDYADAFGNAIEAGVMQREDPALTNFWARHEFLAHDNEDGMDLFFNPLAGVYVRVPRKEVSE